MITIAHNATIFSFAHDWWKPRIVYERCNCYRDIKMQWKKQYLDKILFQEDLYSEQF